MVGDCFFFIIILCVWKRSTLSISAMSADVLGRTVLVYSKYSCRLLHRVITHDVMSKATMLSLDIPFLSKERVKGGA